MNEAETRAEHIDPALRTAGWGVVAGSRITREFDIAPGRIEGLGKPRRALIADYVLVHRNCNLAVIEAKAWGKPLTEGLAQAKQYAEKLAIRFAYSTNGQGIYAVDMETGKEGPIAAFPSPEELWQRLFAVENAWRDRFADIPFEDRGGYFQGRYYQEIAIDRVLAAVAAGRNRVLLTLATGTGKTFIAFQIAWKLFHSRWNLSRQPSRRPRILFLADRNILADQAYNSFSAFPEDALVRIQPDDIRKKGKVPKNGSIFFTIFQTFMSGPAGRQQGEQEDEGEQDEQGEPEDPSAPIIVYRRLPDDPPTSAPVQPNSTEPQPAVSSPYFGEYPPDFFDFIIIDECHRGGANDESTWRGILDYFSPAVQLGLTATPKRRDNVDTYEYFGEPVFIYSLREGVNDGFLTPFKVKQIATTLDEYIYTPDDQVLEGEIEPARRYKEKDFNKTIVIDEREIYRVRLLLRLINQSEKTLVFCANQEHAQTICNLINQFKSNPNPNYCHRVTANDGALGDQHLRDFQDNEKTIPTVLTTSQKLSTGVDARNIRNIVLLRVIRSMIEFKQIIGRGTRLFEDKTYFTIYDFVGAHQHFNDQEWDGEPLPPEEPEPKPEPNPQPEPDPDPESPDDPDAPTPGSRRVKVRLADGKERTIQHMMLTSYWHPDGTPMSGHQFMQELFGALPDFFKDEDELRTIWSDPETRSKLLEGLSELGFGHQQLEEMQQLIDAENSDLFDVLAHIAYARAPLTRQDRANQAEIAITSNFSEKQQAFLHFVLSQYIKVGVEELAQEKLKDLLKLKYNNAISDALKDLGTTAEIRNVFQGFQKYLYE